MRMFRFRRSKGYGAIVDIHSGSVGMAIVDLGASMPQPPLYAHREYLKIAATKTKGERELGALKEALLEASRQFKDTGLKMLRAQYAYARIEEVLFAYGVPWAHTATRFIKVEDPVPFVVSREQIGKLVAEAETKDEAELEDSEDLKVALIERAVIHTALNGYLTEMPHGKEATELSLAHISGLVPKNILALADGIEDTLVPHAIRRDHTLGIALFSVVRDLYPDVAQGLLINISAEATELAVMQDEVLIESTTVPCGAHTFLRQIADALGTIPEEAAMHLREYGKGTSAKVSKIIAAAAAAYTACLEEALAHLKTKYVLPHTVFLLANQDLDTFFGDVIKKAMEPYYKKHGEFYFLNTVLRTKDGTDPKLPYDAFFGIEARFFHKQHHLDETSL
jgi:hypothetical protein